MNSKIFADGVQFDQNAHQLHIQDVVKVYDGSDGPKTVLDNVDLQVSQGEFVTLVGPSGCGKSTLLRLILGQERPTSGGLYFNGEPIGDPDPTRGIVYQKYSLFPHLSVLGNAMLGDRLSMGFAEWQEKKKEVQDRAEGLLATAQLMDHLHKYSGELSGGQQQRAAIIQTLMKEPKILLMDEPFGALDAGSRERMQVFLLKLWERTGTTIVFVTHDLEEAVFLGTRVVVLSQYYTDDRNLAVRGSRIVGDIPVGVRGEASSTQSKLDPRFSETVEHIRDIGFQPDHLRHVEEFDLSHPDSFHTVRLEEMRVKE